MLTKVILEGVMGNKFGRTWNLAVSSPSEALRMIDANKPGLANWVRQNKAIYDRYRVVCTYETGNKEDIGETDYLMERKVKVIRFVPIPAGAGAVGKIVVGAVLVVAGFVAGGPSNPLGSFLINMGASMIIGGIIQALTPMPKRQERDQSSDGRFDSNYFNGPVNTDQQGSPVPIPYGRVLVGSHAISATLTIDKLK